MIFLKRFKKSFVNEWLAMPGFEPRSSLIGRFTP
jgi:hypothetical protein